MKHIMTLLSILLFYLNASYAAEISNKTDYDFYLNEKPIEQIALQEAEYNFWRAKFDQANNQFTYLTKMANAQNALFQLTGNISNLSQATELLERSNYMTNCANAATLRSLARNYISEHRFSEALNILLMAEENGENLSETKKMLFDVYMETGDYIKAEFYLNDLGIGFHDFDYLIRKSKWEDHQGNLSNAIHFMRRALDGVQAANNRELIQWTITNLADYYGHDGQIKRSYNYYLKALELDPTDAYAKKGIAWLVYSYERDPKEAIRILEIIKAYHKSPEYDLLLAEIFEFQADKSKQDIAENLFLKRIEGEEDFGNMYNKYFILLNAKNTLFQDKVLAMAEYEVGMRPTAQSYSLLAWVYYNKGLTKKAQDIMTEKVLNKTYEPEPQFLMAQVLNTEDTQWIKEIKKELLDSAYELGPIAEQTIKNL